VPEDHLTIAVALAAASYGDTVSLAPGTHYEHDLVWPPGVSILGRSSSPEWVVVDAQYLGRVLGGEDLVPENELGFLTLRNGHEPGLYGSGLMVVGSPHLHDLIIEDCISATLIQGVGLHVRGGAIIVDCVLRNNRSSAPSAAGGGAYVQAGGTPGSHPSLTRVEFYGNEAQYGAGLAINGRWGRFEDLYIHDNLGTGLHSADGSVYGGPDPTGPTIVNSLFENNDGCGILFNSGLILENCTIVGNTPPEAYMGALFAQNTWDDVKFPLITGCIVAFNKGGGVGRYDYTPFTIECSDVYGNTGGNYVGTLGDQTGLNDNISLDPLFCPPGGSAPYGLQGKSPCAPANNSCGLLMGAFDVHCPGTATETTSWGRVKSLY
jgi:hypothetical protein